MKMISDNPDEQGKRIHRDEEITPNQSILSQRKDPLHYPEITYLAGLYSKIRIYRDWNFGPENPLRYPQKTDMPEDFLNENCNNLALVLNNLMLKMDFRELLIKKLRDFSECIRDISFDIHGGTIQICIHEEGMKGVIPASRLSDGTLKYLCLLAILCHHEPPPLICIEEPEIGLHPDMVSEVAKLLVEASRRTQLIVTTHSVDLVDALSQIPEAIVVCEKETGQTIMGRLDANNLKKWLDKYSLGDLWVSGELGGNRW